MIERVSEFTYVNRGLNWAGISAGENHSFAWTVDGDLYAWGNGRYGALGDGNASKDNIVREPKKVSSRKWKKASAGDGTSFAIDTNGNLFSCGKGNYYQHGHGYKDDVPSFTQLGTGVWIDVSCGSSHAVAIRDDGSAWGVGHGGQGQLGIGVTTMPGPRGPVAYMAQELIKIHDGPFISCDVGGLFTALIDKDRHLWTCGENNLGQCGHGLVNGVPEPNYPTLTMIPVKTFDLAACGGNHLLAVDLNGDLYACGANESGQLGYVLHPDKDYSVLYAEYFTLSKLPEQIMTDNKVVAIAAGASHSMALLLSGDLYGCGMSWDGRTGVDLLHQASYPTQGMAFIGKFTRCSYDKKKAAVSAGGFHTLALDKTES